ncbi:MAG: hypothetical protein CM15mP127_02770 [Gammaproteobacteria bacterium]|nr:MAG: hypothetical protein CM15mP127_02770 [Gammaproteobacteria bacterium]
MKFKNKLPNWLETVKILQIWDDHDYGLNDGGKNYRHKEVSQEIYLNFWEFHKMISEDIKKESF